MSFHEHISCRGLDRLVSITPTKFLKLFFFDEEASYSTGAKILLLSDDRSVGASEDILVSNILTDWCRPTAAFEGLSRFQVEDIVVLDTL